MAKNNVNRSPETGLQPQNKDAGKQVSCLPIVGIGASAGGLEAFKSFFHAMQPDSGMAFILIQHLDPNHETLMVELLSKCTAMPVWQAVDGQQVEADQVYMIPPNRSLTIRDGVLYLTEPVERRGMRMVIDTFLRSLAEDQREGAIGIVLSGTGSDGTEGLKAIKAQGGLTLVQDPDSAAHDGMPRSAIATGLVDVVCPVEQMPEVLSRYADHSYSNGNGLRRGLNSDTDSDLNSLLGLLLTRHGIDFRHYKRATLLRRIERRMGLNHVDAPADYLALLRKRPEEVERLGKDLMIGVTSFFRDPEIFDALEQQVISKLVVQTPTDGSLRIWVPGCATGEEAYTLAMLFSEQMTAQGKALSLQIFGSDIDDDALEVARAGHYPAGSAADLTARRMELHFIKSDGDSDRWTIKKTLRESVVFARQNLIADPPFSKLDLISCRNLMIYLQPAVQDKLIVLFHFALKAGGYLLLGSSENIGRHTGLFRPVRKKWRIYQSIDTQASRYPAMPFSLNEKEPRPALEPATPRRLRERRPRLAEFASRWVLDEYAPATVIVNRRFESLYFCGNVGRYLHYPHGEPNLNVLDMVREGMVTQLRAALQRVFESNKMVDIGHVRMRYEGRYQPVRLRIKPLRDQPGTAEELAMVSFIETESPPGIEQNPASDMLEDTDALLMRQLEDELKTTKEDLQSTLEEMETSNEELKASNEEMMSINEELQSTNEELETSKEELHSLNEELVTVNNQLQGKVSELEQAHNDILNLLNSTSMATLFLDPQLHIKRFTPAATQLFHLIPTDIGRPLEDLAKRFADPDLLEDARRVLTKLIPVETEVEHVEGHWFTRRVLPYRTEDGRIDGVVVTFADITELRLRTRQQALSAKLGRTALAGVTLQELLHDAVIKTASGLNVEYCKVLELLPDQNTLLLKAGVGWKDGYIGSAQVDTQADSQAGFTLMVSKTSDKRKMDVGPVVFVEDVAHETRFHAPPLLVEHNIVSGLSVTIPGMHQPYGVLGAHSGRKRSFTSEDGDFLRGVAHILASAIERRRIEVHLRERAEEIQTLLDTLPVGVFIAHDTQAQRITGNRAAQRLLRSPTESNLSKTAPKNERPSHFRVYREGKELKPDELPVQRAAAGDYVPMEEVEHVFDDGSVYHTLVSATPLFDAYGKARGAVATILDISARKQAEEALSQEKERAQVTLASIGDAVITTDSKGFVEYLNPIAEELTGWPAAEAQGKPLGEVFRIINESDSGPVSDPVSRCLSQDKVLKLEFGTILISSTGGHYAIEASAAPIHDRHGQTLGVVLVFLDVTEQHRLTREIRHQASHDMLTGLLNRLEFEQRLTRVLRTAQHESSYHVLCYLDLDRFKIVNDTCGHAAGDELLRQIAELFRNNLRQRDTLARLGGDEFGLLLEHCTLEQAQLTAEKLRKSLEEFEFNWQDQTFHISVSIGMVPIEAKSGTPEEILQAADSACYAAKHAGRNQAHIQDGDRRAH